MLITQTSQTRSHGHIEYIEPCTMNQSPCTDRTDHHFLSSIMLMTLASVICKMQNNEKNSSILMSYKQDFNNETTECHHCSHTVSAEGKKLILILVCK